MTQAQRLLVLWLLMVICMMLHFNFHVSDIFYGIDVASKPASGTRPFALIVLRLLFNLLPMLFIILLLFFSGRWMQWLMLIVSPLYTIAHAEHLVGTLREAAPDPSQIMLLCFTLAMSVLQVGVAWRWWRQSAQ